MNKKLSGILGLMFLAAGVYAQSITNVITSGLSEPHFLTTDPYGNLYITDGGAGNCVYKFTAAKGLKLFAGNTGVFGSDDGIGEAATFDDPSGIAYTGGYLFVSDFNNHTIRRISITNGSVLTIAGQVGNYSGAIDGVGTSATFCFPSGLAADSAGNIYVADFGNGAVRKIENATATNLSMVKVTTLTTAFSSPEAVAVWESTNGTGIYVADTMANRIGEIWIDTAWGFISSEPVIGTGDEGVHDSTYGLSAILNQPRGLYVGDEGTFFTDTGNNLLRNIYYNTNTLSLATQTVTNGFDEPIGVTVNEDGFILVADSKTASVIGYVPESQPTPTLSYAAGSYSNAISVGFTTTLPNEYSRVFRFTTNGTSVYRSSPNGTSLVLDGGYNSTNLPLQVRCYAGGFSTSANVSNNYSFFVSGVSVSPTNTSGSDSILVSFNSDTKNAAYHYTLDDTVPTTNSPVAQSVTIASNCVLKIMASKTGYADSAVFSSQYTITVAAPTITFSSGTNSNCDAVLVTLSSSNKNDVIRYTTNGLAPTDTEGYTYTGTAISFSSNCTLNVIAMREGCSDSDVVSEDLSFYVDMNVVSGALVGTNLFDCSQIQISSLTKKTHYTYSIGGVETDSTDGSVQGIIYTNFTFSVTATNDDLPGIVATTNFDCSVVLSAPKIGTAGGYFPAGAWVPVTTDATANPYCKVYYTVDGNDPTNTDNLYSSPGILFDQVTFPLLNLSALKVRAVGTNGVNVIASDVVSGKSVTGNTIGVPNDFIAGPGSTVVLPIVANMAGTQELRSVQMRFEVTPKTEDATIAKNMGVTSKIEVLTMSSNDFVVVSGNSSDGYSAQISSTTYTTNYDSAKAIPTTGIELYSIATNLYISEYGVIANLKVKIPKTAPIGSQYSLKVLNVSGTSDGSQNVLDISALADATLTVKSVEYVVGNVTPGSWYNAGDFGRFDGTSPAWDNADVNAVFQASLGVHVPYAGTDVYNAMDVYPEAGVIMGDGLITYLDWQRVLDRSLGRNLDWYVRFWKDSGSLAHTNYYNSGSPIPTNQTPEVRIVNVVTDDSSDVWLRQAMLVVGTVTNAEPGAVCSVPVSVRVLPGFSLDGLQFRATVDAVDSAPTAGMVDFKEAGAVPAPIQYHFTPNTNNASCAWSLNTFAAPLQGSNLLGYLTFTVPADALAGQSYSVKLLYPGGAADSDNELALETVSGSIWVRSAPTNAPQHLVSDEWKTNYFGSVTNAYADPMADPDNDGVPNWMEFLAGTNPTNAASHLQFSGVRMTGEAGRALLQWNVVAGRVYVVESCPDLVNGQWTAVQTNTADTSPLGASIDVNKNGSCQFYRLRVQEP